MPKTGDALPNSPRRDAATADAASTRRLAWLIGPALVAGRRLPRPGQRREQHDRRRALRLPAGLGRRARQRHGVAHPVPLGEARDRHRPEPARDPRAPHPQPMGRRAYWLQAELVAMATDIAEVIGGAVALNLLFGIPLLWGGLITGTVSLVLLLVQSRRGPRTFEFVVIGLVAIIAIGFTFGVFIGAARSGRRRRRPRPPLRRRRLGAARGIHPRRDDHAARDLRAQRARARPVRARRRRQAAHGRRGTATPTTAPRRSASRSRSRSCAASRPPACCARRSGTSRSRCSSPAP